MIASGGKRLRPALTLICAKLCAYEGDRHISLAACVEFIHTATLLHDDVVDESALRRGSATANDVWGNKASVLVGDFLLSRAFQLMVSDGSLQVLKILSDASAVIAQGEVMQLSTAGNTQTTVEDYLEVVTAKTATLFAAACELGAVVSGQHQHEERLSEAGMALGIAFQIMDDALDYAAEQSTLGKEVGDDFRDGKITLPVILAYQDGTEDEKKFWKRTLEDQEVEGGDLEQAIKIIHRYQAIEKSIALAERYCDTARELLSAFPDSAPKQALLETVAFCTQRSY
jgi:octaprenyl-diphosphate synthase